MPIARRDFVYLAIISALCLVLGWYVKRPAEVREKIVTKEVVVERERRESATDAKADTASRERAVERVVYKAGQVVEVVRWKERDDAVRTENKTADVQVEFRDREKLVTVEKTKTVTSSPQDWALHVSVGLEQDRGRVWAATLSRRVAGPLSVSVTAMTSRAVLLGVGIAW